MMPAAKHGDVQMGVDIHLCMVPTPAPTPTPLPTPHMSVVFDPFDYVPVIGATITVCGMKRATAGTAGKVVHIPPGFPFAPKLPDSEDELFMGSSTVVADGDPMSHIAHPVLACQAAGMMSPFRLKKKGGPRAMVLPTVFNLATPTTVFVGGPPTISLMGMAMKGVFAGLGKLAKMGVFKRLRQKLFKNMKPGFLKCTILRAEPVNILNGAVSVEQQDFHLPGRIDIDWLRCYSSADAHVGVCGPGWQTLLDIRLEVDAADGSVLLQGPGVGPLSFDHLPTAPGDAGEVLELTDGARLTDQGDEWQVRTKDGRIYCFAKRLARRTAAGHGLAPIERITDRCGNAWTLDYRNGRPHALMEAAGRRLALTMQDDRLVAVTLVDEATRRDHGFVRYEYDAAGDLVAVIDALGAAFRFAYGSGPTARHLLRHTNRVGLSFHYTYEAAPDGSQRVVHSWGDGGLYDYRFEYLDALNERRITDSLGHVSLVKLDDRGLPINEIDPLGGMTVYEYDDAGRTTAVVDPAGRRTEWAYDDHGNLLRLQRPDGAAISLAYQDDRAVTVTEPAGACWQQQFDAAGRLVAQTSPLGHVSQYQYDALGQLVAFTNARGACTRLRYGPAGELAAMEDALGHATHWQHDALGRVVARQDALGAITRFAYDAKSRLVAVQLPTGEQLRYEHDAADRLTAHVDARGGRLQLDHAGLGCITRRVQPDGAVVHYRYDTEERLVGVCNQRGQWHQLQRDALGRVVQELDYWGQAWRTEYTANGCLAARTDPLGRRITYRCDALGRVVGRQSRRGATVWEESLSFDANGRLVAAANPWVKLSRRFDAEGRLLHELQAHADGATFELALAYDAAGNRVRRRTGGSIGGGHEVEMAYDLLDRLLAWRVDGGPAATVARDALGQVVEEQWPSGLARRSRHDAQGRLLAQAMAGPAGTVFERRYAYEADQLVARDDSAFGIDRFVHDPMGRIVEHVDPQGLLHRHAHDAAGDLLSTRVHAASPEPPAAGPDDWARGGELDGAAYRFDRAGQLRQRQDASGHTELVWDAHQRLLASRHHGRSTPGAATVITTYGYDPLGRRLFKDTAGQRTRFGWDGDAIAADARPGQRPRDYLMWPGGFEPLALLDGETLVYSNDPNGAPVRLTDAAGRVRWCAVAAPGGWRQGAAVAPVDNPLRLQGQYADSETGLFYNRHRYYEPRLNAYVSPDPLGLRAGENLQAYGPDIFAWIDPHGLSQTYWLEKSMEAAGRPMASGQTAHHIVQQNNPSKYADLSRDLLARNGLDTEIAENGARLWGTAGSQVATSAHPGRVNARGIGNYHAGAHIHSPANDKLIYGILRRAEERGGATGVRAALGDIGKRMEGGSWLRAFKACGG